MKRKNLAQKYLSEKINFGGQIYTRGHVIHELQKSKTPQKYIDAYMMGARTIKKRR